MAITYCRNKNKKFKIMWKALINLIEKWGCHHDWEHWKTVDVNDLFHGTYTVYHFCCKKCGKFKTVKSRDL